MDYKQDHNVLRAVICWRFFLVREMI